MPPQHESRPFGVYTEILLILRKAFEKANNCEMVVDATQAYGVPVWRDAGLSFGNYRMFYCHPLDYVWALVGHDLGWYSVISQQWRMWRIEQMARQAEARLNARLSYLNYGRYDDLVYFDGDVTETFSRIFRDPGMIVGGSTLIGIARG